MSLEPSAEPVVPDKPGHFGMYLSGQWWRLAASDHQLADPDPAARLDVAVLQAQLLAPVLGIEDPRTDPRIGFAGGVRDTAELMGLVDSGRWDAAITVHATSVAQLIDVADAGGIMPPKSTWFEPKLRDGLLVHALR
jgi:uncharacterized protein (DUF1015 family)